jgi:23S rRNA (pseudouridine1915-N3)-methyltransferase
VKLTMVVVGKVKGSVAEAVADYEERARRYWKLEVVEVSQGPRKGGDDPDQVRAGEGERIRARVPEGGEVWVLHRDGQSLPSVALARILGQRGVEGSPGITFVIGGAFGVDGELLRSADRRLSISAMTLPHEVARLVLAEQLYRAGTILRGEPYHKGGR